MAPQVDLVVARADEEKQWKCKILRAVIVSLYLFAVRSAIYILRSSQNNKAPMLLSKFCTRRPYTLIASAFFIIRFY